MAMTRLQIGAAPLQALQVLLQALDGVHGCVLQTSVLLLQGLETLLSLSELLLQLLHLPLLGQVIDEFNRCPCVRLPQ
jgi:hypothetical protein